MAVVSLENVVKSSFRGGQRVEVLHALNPTGDLDREGAEEILQLLTILNRMRAKTIIKVTHDPRAAAYANRLLHMDKGSPAREESKTAV
jgi:ABC-type lipoprotein export system ATPase subunit